MRAASAALLAALCLCACDSGEPQAEQRTWVAPRQSEPAPGSVPSEAPDGDAPAPDTTVGDASAAPGWHSQGVGFVWHELLSPAPAAAAAFYTEVFGWSRDARSQESRSAYIRLQEGESIFAGVMSLAAYQWSGPARWTSWVGVDAKSPALLAALDAGALALERHVDHPYGMLALIEDPAGAMLGVVALRGGCATAPGPIVRHELLLDEPQAASDFYRRWLGWPAPETSPDGSLRLASAGGLVIFGAPALHGLSTVAPAWVPGFVVDDLAAVRERAVARGATIVREFVEMPDERRVLRVRDPQGAVFLVLQRRS